MNSGPNHRIGMTINPINNHFKNNFVMEASIYAYFDCFFYKKMNTENYFSKMNYHTCIIAILFSKSGNWRHFLLSVWCSQ